MDGLWERIDVTIISGGKELEGRKGRKERTALQVERTRNTDIKRERQTDYMGIEKKKRRRKEGTN